MASPSGSTKLAWPWRVGLANSKARLGSAVKLCSEHWRPVRAICASFRYPRRATRRGSVRSRQQIAQEMTSVGETAHPNDRGPWHCHRAAPRREAKRIHGGDRALDGGFARCDRNRRRRIDWSSRRTNEKLRAGMTEVINRLVNSSAGLQRAISATGTISRRRSIAERTHGYFRLDHLRAPRDQSTQPIHASRARRSKQPG